MDIFNFSALFHQSEGKVFGPGARSERNRVKEVERQERTRQPRVCICVYFVVIKGDAEFGFASFLIKLTLSHTRAFAATVAGFKGSCIDVHEA